LSKYKYKSFFGRPLLFIVILKYENRGEDVNEDRRLSRTSHKTIAMGYIDLLSPRKASEQHVRHIQAPCKSIDGRAIRRQSISI